MYFDRFGLRHFQMPSNTLVYTTGGLAEFTIPNKLRGGARAAIIGISVYYITALRRPMLNLLTKFDVAGRQYFQGDPMPVALITGGPAVIPDQFVAAPALALQSVRGYFPGSFIPLSDGSYCSGFKLCGQEQITIALQDSAGANTNPLLQVVLHCVEFPQARVKESLMTGPEKNQQAIIEDMWKRFAAGEGQCHIQNINGAVTAATYFTSPMQAQVQQPHERDVRRRELRGVFMDRVTPDCLEDEFVTATAQANTSSTTPSSALGVPARNLIGHAALNWTDEVSVDLKREDYSICRFNLLPTTTGYLSIAHIFEGKPEGLPALCGPSVF